MDKRKLAFCLSLMLMLSGCGKTELPAVATLPPKLPTETEEASSLETTLGAVRYDDSLLREIVRERTYQAYEEDPPIDCVYRLPLLPEDTEGGKAVNEWCEEQVRMLESPEAPLYESVRWKSTWTGSLVSILAEMEYLGVGTVQYQAFHYDFAEGKLLNNRQFLEFLKIDPSSYEKALSRAAAEKMDRDMDNIPEAYGEFGPYMLELRAQTISESNLALEAIELFPEGENVKAIVNTATPAGAGLYQRILTPVLKNAGVRKKAELDFVTAELFDNQVTVTFRNEGMAAWMLPEGKTEFDTAYPVYGLYGQYDDMALGYMGNDGTICLFLKDHKGRVTFCNLTGCLQCGSRLMAVGPMPQPQNIEGFLTENGEDGFCIYGVTEDKKQVNLYEYAAWSEGLIHPGVEGSLYLKKNISLSVQDGKARWIRDEEVLAEGIIRYLGMTHEGMHYGLWLTGEKTSHMLLTLKCETPAVNPLGEYKTTICRTDGPSLPGLEEAGKTLELVRKMA